MPRNWSPWAACRHDRVDDALLNRIETEIEEIDWDYLAEEIPSAIEQSREGVQRVTSIVRAMKEFSHPGTKEKVLLDINKIIDTTVTISRNEWKYVADLEMDLDESLPSVPCLSDEMSQVFLNLIVNAAQAIGEQLGDNPEGPKGTIRITTRPLEREVEIRISDTGPGIPEEVRQKIFDPFFTTKDPGKGTGQGLAIARDVVVHKHGGAIEVESEPGQGAVFIIRLPLEMEEEPKL